MCAHAYWQINATRCPVCGAPFETRRVEWVPRPEISSTAHVIPNRVGNGGGGGLATLDIKYPTDR